MEFTVDKFYLTAFTISYFVLCHAKTIPELRFHPKPPSNYESLIWYKANDQGNVTAWARDLDRFLGAYKTPELLPGRGQNLFHCDYDHLPRDNKVCNVNIMDWSPCVTENFYDYHRRSPCVFLSLDKIIGWEPEYYNNTDTLPAAMPEYLKAHIAEQIKHDRRHANQLWVSCTGETPVDIENIGPIQYIPQSGFPGYFFPFSNAPGNLSPLVAIHFQRPLSGIVISVECKIWARNLKNTLPEKQGILHFELLID